MKKFTLVSIFVGIALLATFITTQAWFDVKGLTLNEKFCWRASDVQDFPIHKLVLVGTQGNSCKFGHWGWGTDLWFFYNFSYLPVGQTYHENGGSVALYCLSVNPPSAWVWSDWDDKWRSPCPDDLATNRFLPVLIGGQGMGGHLPGMDGMMAGGEYPAPEEELGVGFDELQILPPVAYPEPIE